MLYPSDKPEDPAKLLDPTAAGQAFSEWAVGKNGELYVEHEAGQFLRAGSEIGWDIHLNASGEETPVEVETAFWFYPKGKLPKYRAMMSAFGYAKAYEIDIPPGQVSRIEAYTTLPAPAIILNFQPHMHFRGKAFTMEAIYPDGRTEVLNSVPQYRFNWHINYVYTKDSAPVLPKGTIIKTTAWHDNTPANKFNPDPAQWVTFGQRSVDEMAHANEVVVYIYRGRLRADHRRAEESGCHQHAAATAVGSRPALRRRPSCRRRRRLVPAITPTTNSSPRRSLRLLAVFGLGRPLTSTTTINLFNSNEDLSTDHHRRSAGREDRANEARTRSELIRRALT